MQRIIYVTGRCGQCGKIIARLANAAIADEDLAPVKCDSCGGEVEFSEMEVWHHLMKEDTGEAQPKRRGLLNIPSESVAEINSLVIVCLCLCAVSIFNRYLENLSQLQTMAVAMGVTLVMRKIPTGRQVPEGPGEQIKGDVKRGESIQRIINRQNLLLPDAEVPLGDSNRRVSEHVTQQEEGQGL